MCTWKMLRENTVKRQNNEYFSYFSKLIILSLSQIIGPIYAPGPTLGVCRLGDGDGKCNIFRKHRR